MRSSSCWTSSSFFKSPSLEGGDKIENQKLNAWPPKPNSVHKYKQLCQKKWVVFFKKRPCQSNITFRPKKLIYMLKKLLLKGTYCCTKLKVPVFRILPLTASSVSFGLETKVIEEINAESQALKFLKSVKGEPSYGCLKFVRGLENEMRENEFVCGRKFRFFAFCRSQLHLTALTWKWKL